MKKYRTHKLTKQFKITSGDKEKYALSTNADFKILIKCKQLEKLNKLVKVLNQLYKKYNVKGDRKWRIIPT